MEHSDLLVKSVYITGHEFKFYIQNFKSIIKYIYLSNNFNQYYLIITNETKEDILAIYNNLQNNQKNPVFNKENLFFICSNEEQTKWCLEYQFNYELNDEPNVTFNDYNPVKLEGPPSWAFENHSRFVNYYNDDKIKIIHLEGLEHNWKILHLLNNSIYALITWPCYFHKWLYEFATNSIFTTNENYNTKNIIFLSPNLDGILFSYEYGFNAILANQNCLLDYNTFNITSDALKYDMVMNCRPELWKRPFLAEKVTNLAYIKGACFGREKYDYTKLNCAFINETRISPKEVNEIYNQSYCGGIFSEMEGACYSSSEYLLSGLPVISTFSKGGRDTWYTPQNSIIVEPTQDAVETAVKTCIQKINNGDFVKQNIRDKHIEMSHKMRNNIINCTQHIFDSHNVNIDASEYWNKNFFHKFINNVDIDEVKNILKIHIAQINMHNDFVENHVKFMYGKYYDEIIQNKNIIIKKSEITVNTLDKKWNIGKYYCLISDVLNGSDSVENMHGNNTNNHKYITELIQKYFSKESTNYVLKFNYHDYMIFDEFILTHNRLFNSYNQVLVPYVNYNDKTVLITEDNLCFKNKGNNLIWRGQTSGRHILNLNTRCNIILTNFNVHPNIDIGFSCFMNTIYKDNKSVLDQYYKPPVSKNEILNHKFFLNIDGNDWSSSFLSALSSNCCPLHNYPFGSVSWIFAEIKPYVHFVPVKNDGSDLVEIYNWCMNNLDKCEEIANNSKKYIENIYNNYDKIIERFFELYPLVFLDE